MQPDTKQVMVAGAIYLDYICIHSLDKAPGRFQYLESFRHSGGHGIRKIEDDLHNTLGQNRFPATWNGFGFPDGGYVILEW